MGVAHLGLALRRPAFGPWAWSAVGLCGLIRAGFNGASFLNYGHDFSSMLMSLGFAIALVGYGMGLVTSSATAPGPTVTPNGAGSLGNQ